MCGIPSTANERCRPCLPLGTKADYVNWAKSAAGVTRAWCFAWHNGIDALPPQITGTAEQIILVVCADDNDPNLTASHSALALAKAAIALNCPANIQPRNFSFFVGAPTPAIAGGLSHECHPCNPFRSPCALIHFVPIQRQSSPPSPAQLMSCSRPRRIWGKSCWPRKFAPPSAPCQASSITDWSGQMTAIRSA